MATRTSPDYEEPNTNVANKPDPVTLPTNMARQAESKGHMGTVLLAGMALAIGFLLVAYLMSAA
jgi:hypothetical protein